MTTYEMTQDETNERDDTGSDAPQEGRPPAVNVRPENVPETLRQFDQWVVWRLVPRDSGRKWKKVPYQPGTGDSADCTDPQTWCSFETASEAYRDKSNNYDGIGFVLSSDGSVVGIDLDHCVEHDGKNITEVKPWAEEVIKAISSYSELSPTGTGLHSLVLGALPEGKNRIEVTGTENGLIELYDRDRYLTVTGHAVQDLPPDLSETSVAFSEIRERLSSPDPDLTTSSPATDPPEVTSPTPDTSDLFPEDRAVLEKARASESAEKFNKLWEGDKTLWEGDSAVYESHSEADQALCAMLAYWTDNDRDQMDRLFRASGLMREKWKRDDYRKRTLNNAVDREFSESNATDSDTERQHSAETESTNQSEVPSSSSDSEELPLPVVRGPEVRDLPNPDWQIEGLWLEESQVTLYGEEGSYKTFTALDMALSLATNTSFHGREVSGGQVVYMYAEGKYGLKSRVLAWADLHRQDPNDLNDITFVPTSVNLMDDDGQGLENLSEVIASQAGGSAALVVLDTLARAFGAGDENDTKDMNTFINRTGTLKHRFGASVLAVHHTGWDTSREKGNRNLRNNFDTVIRTEASDSSNRITYSCEKQKDADFFDDFELEAREVVPRPEITSIVLMDTAQDRGATTDTRVRSYIKDNPGCSASELRDGVRARDEDVDEARNRLMNWGHIENRGDPSQHKYFLRDQVSEKVA